MSQLPHLNLLHDEGEPDTYRGVRLRMGSEDVTFNTGVPTVDYLTAHFVINRRITDAGADPDDIPILNSSDVDHFVMDGGELRDEKPTDDDMVDAIKAAKAHLGLA